MIKIGVTMPGRVDDAGDFLANVRALEAAGAELVGLDGDSAEQWVMLGAIAAATERVMLRITGSEPAAVRALSRGRAIAGTPENERWVELEMPPDRDSWAAMLRDQETEGVTGVIVPWDERLIDLLRNPDADDRGDLLMSTG